MLTFNVVAETVITEMMTAGHPLSEPLHKHLLTAHRTYKQTLPSRLGPHTLPTGGMPQTPGGSGPECLLPYIAPFRPGRNDPLTDGRHVFLHLVEGELP